jgi:signal peptidase I
VIAAYEILAALLLLGFLFPKKAFDGFPRSLASAFVCVLTLRTFLLEPFNIPSGSMIPSLLVGDYLVVSRFTYGYGRFSVPFGYLLPPLKGRVFPLETPKQGDVVVFRLPTDPKTDYIKRVIGTPGDRIELKDGVIYVNDTPANLDKKGLYEKRADEKGGIVKADLYEETLPNGTKHLVIHQKPLGEGYLDNTPVYVVPEGCYFVMGDNRTGSLDSRVLHEIGYIPEEYLIGRAQVVFFSTDDRARFWQPWKWPFATRWGDFPHFIV